MGVLGTGLLVDKTHMWSALLDNQTDSEHGWPLNSYV